MHCQYFAALPEAFNLLTIPGQAGRVYRQRGNGVDFGCLNSNFLTSLSLAPVSYAGGAYTERAVYEHGVDKLILNRDRQKDSIIPALKELFPYIYSSSYNLSTIQYHSPERQLLHIPSLQAPSCPMPTHHFPSPLLPRPRLVLRQHFPEMISRQLPSRL